MKAGAPGDRREVVEGAEFKMAIDDPAAGDWCNLSWTQWQPLEAASVRAVAPVSSGIYRIRRAGVANRLTYIGQTGRTLRERLLALANGTHAEQCPFNDPHSCAASLAAGPVGQYATGALVYPRKRRSPYIAWYRGYAALASPRREQMLD